MRKTTVCLLVLVMLLGLGAGTARAEGAMDEAARLAEGADRDNGKLVYLAGYNLKVERMQQMGGPQWLQMHGGSCASCHGPGGRGGMFPMQCDLSSPGVDFATLAGEGGYAPGALRHALEQGETPTGDELDQCMPRWFLSDADFRDLLAHLLSLGAR